MSYHYFAATLPMLTKEQPPPLSLEEFRVQCASHLTPRDLAAINQLLDNTPAKSAHPFVTRWSNADGHLRNAIARTRAERLRKDFNLYTRDVDDADMSVEREVADAYTRPTPLEREKAIDSIRWNRLEEMAGLDPFSSSAVLAYGLKLTILKRWDRMDKANGTDTLEALVQRKPADKENNS